MPEDFPNASDDRPNKLGTPGGKRRRRWPWVTAAALVIAAGAAWWWSDAWKKPDAQAARRGPGAIPVTTAKAESRDVPVRLTANGTVTALQSVELRAQITSTVKEVHIREGQTVHKGDLLFTLDSRTDDANLKKALAQVEKDKADLATAVRNLERQKELFGQKFIAQAALDTVQNSVDTLTGQLAIDQAAVESARAALTYTRIHAPFSGRTGAIGVRAGSLVQPGATAAPLVTVTQIDPIAIAFTVPEQELAALQDAMRAGNLIAQATPQAGGETFKGKVAFIDNAVDTATGTIRVKAEFSNPKALLWPGMYANVQLSTRTISNATVVPTQAVQTGPERRFVYVVQEDRKVVAQPVKVAYLEETFAVVEGLAPGARVVVEGAQNLRPGSTVAEADRSTPDAPRPAKGEGKKGKKAASS
jgi:RND family efflux transporter MFP subunit